MEGKQPNSAGSDRLVPNPIRHCRYVRTLRSLRKILPPPARILDLVTPNPL